MSDVEAMLWVLGLTPEQRAAKVVGLATLRGEMYDRNLQVGACVGGGAWWAGECLACRSVRFASGASRRTTAGVRSRQRP